MPGKPRHAGRLVIAFPKTDIWSLKFSINMPSAANRFSDAEDRLSMRISTVAAAAPHCCCSVASQQEATKCRILAPSSKNPATPNAVSYSSMRIALQKLHSPLSRAQMTDVVFYVLSGTHAGVVTRLSVRGSSLGVVPSQEGSGSRIASKRGLTLTFHYLNRVKDSDSVGGTMEQ